MRHNRSKSRKECIEEARARAEAEARAKAKALAKASNINKSTVTAADIRKAYVKGSLRGSLENVRLTDQKTR